MIGPGQQLHSQSSPGDLVVVEGQKNNKLGLMCQSNGGQALGVPDQISCCAFT